MDSIINKIGEERIWNSMFLRICLINFVMMFGQNMSNTLIPKFADSLGATPMLVGMITSAFSISSLLIKPVSAPAIDSFPKRNVLLIGTVLIAISFLGYGFSNSLELLFISRLIHGCGLGFTVITCLTMVSDVVPKEKLTTGIAYFSIAQAIAQAVGPGIGLYLSDTLGYASTFLLSMLIIGISVALILSLKTPQQEKVQFKISTKQMIAREAIIPAIMMMLLALAFTNISSFLVLFATSIGVKDIGLYFTVNAVFLLISRPFIGRLSDHFGIIKILPWSITCFAVSLLMISIADNLILFLLAAIVNAFGYGACQPMIQSLCMKSVPPERRGSASATSYYGTDIGYLLGPVVAGKLVEAFGYAVMFRFMSIFLVFAILLLFLFKKRLKYIDEKGR